MVIVIINYCFITTIFNFITCIILQKIQILIKYFMHLTKSIKIKLKRKHMHA